MLRIKISSIFKRLTLRHILGLNKISKIKVSDSTTIQLKKQPLSTSLSNAINNPQN